MTRPHSSNSTYPVRGWRWRPFRLSSFWKESRCSARLFPLKCRISRISVSSQSIGYLRAMKEGKTLGLLLQREGREQVASRIIEKAQGDSVFAVELTFRPRQTLEMFLDVKIPEVVSLSVVVEDSGTFGLVVPRRAN
jgi:hypothetical protein